MSFERGEKTLTPKISALLRKQPVLLRDNFVLTKDRKRPYYRHFCGKMHSGDGLGGSARDIRVSPLDVCAFSRELDRMSAGPTGHVHGTHGTRPRDGCDPRAEVSRQISLCLLFSSSSHWYACKSGRIGRKHPSRDVIFSGQNLAQKCPKKLISLDDVLELQKHFQPSAGRESRMSRIFGGDAIQDGNGESNF